MKKILSLFGAIGLIGISAGSSSFLVSCGHGKSSSDKHKNDIVVIDPELKVFITEAKYLSSDKNPNKIIMNSEEDLTNELNTIKNDSDILSKALTISLVKTEDAKGAKVTLTINKGYKVEDPSLLSFKISNIFE